MKYTVKQLADLAGVTVRTLHYYDQIGLLTAPVVGQNGYRYYDEGAVLRLQQIMFYRELDFSLAEIQAIIDEPEFDLPAALQSHKRLLQQRLGRLSDLIQTIDSTLLHLQGVKKVDTQALFSGFDEARQAQYEQEIAEQYGEERVKESRRRWDSNAPEQKAQIQAEGGAIYTALAALTDHDPASAEVQQLVARWHQHIRHFYEPTPEILAGLGQTYAQHPEFVAFYQRLHPALPEFLHQAIQHYCRNLPGAKQADIEDDLVDILRKKNGQK